MQGERLKPQEVTPLSEEYVQILLNDYSDAVRVLLTNASLYGVSSLVREAFGRNYAESLTKVIGENTVRRHVLVNLGQEEVVKEVYVNELTLFIENFGHRLKDFPSMQEQAVKVREELGKLQSSSTSSTE